MLKIGRFRMSLAVIPVMAVMGYLNGIEKVAAFFAALIIHECAHGIMASALGVRFYSVELLPFGCVARIENMGTLSGGKEVAIAAAGPVLSMAVAAGIYAWGRVQYMGAFSEAFKNTNLMLGAMNLLPALPLDGGRIVYTVLGMIIPKDTANRVGGIVGIFAGVAIFALGVIEAISSGFNMTMFTMGGFLIYAAVRQLKYGLFSFVRSDEEKRRRLTESGCLDVKSHAVGKNRTVGETLTSMDTRKFNIVYVVDEDTNEMRTVTERDVIRCAVEKNSTVKMGDVKRNGR